MAAAAAAALEEEAAGVEFALMEGLHAFVKRLRRHGLLRPGPS